MVLDLLSFTATTLSLKPAAPAPVGTVQPRPAPAGARYRCKEIGSFAKAQ